MSYVGSAPHTAGEAAAPRPHPPARSASGPHRGSASTSRLSSCRSPVCDGPIRRVPPFDVGFVSGVVSEVPRVLLSRGCLGNVAQGRLVCVRRALSCTQCELCEDEGHQGRGAGTEAGSAASSPHQLALVSLETTLRPSAHTASGTGWLSSVPGAWCSVPEPGFLGPLLRES